MPPEPLSALDRYLCSRGAMILYGNQTERAAKIQTIVGAALAGVAGLFGAIAVATHNPGILGATIGPGLAGAINLGVGAFIRRHSKRTMRSQVTLTGESWQFIVRLMKGIMPPGWSYLIGRRSMRSARLVTYGLQVNQPVPQTSAKGLLREESFELLDHGAGPAMRIFAALSNAPETLNDLRPTLVNAADHAMADLIGIALRIENGGDPALAQEDARPIITGLLETAERVEEACRSRREQGVGTASTQLLGQVLDRLRLDQAARDELETSTEEQVEKNRIGS